MQRAFFEAPSTEIAPLLLGSRLVAGAVTLRITEVEAYRGAEDPGSHSFRGRNKRNGTLYGEPGHLYAYFTYGMHVCANVVCGPEDSPYGVLLRAGEIIDGIDVARERRTTSKVDADLARGPARLAVALGISLTDDGSDLLSTDPAAPFRLELAEEHAAFEQGVRTGVSGP
ncbi:MAG: DNA-3-methyladenine glycosylase, partial [Glaciihabitans sp.]|nr:DNA-3-methyladenine glycosylase [Glaciihabitans sp.]